MKTKMQKIILVSGILMVGFSLNLSAQANNKTKITQKDTVKQDKTSVRNEKAIPADTYMGKDLDSTKSKKPKKNKNMKEKSKMYIVPDSTKRKNK